MVEAKTTAAKQYTLKSSDIAKVRKAAMFEGRQWSLWIELGDGRKVVVMDANVLVELEEQYRAECRE